MSDFRATISRTEADIKQCTKRKKEIEAEIEKLSRQIGPFSMTVTNKRQELLKEEEKIRKLQEILARCNKELGIK